MYLKTRDRAGTHRSSGSLFRGLSGRRARLPTRACFLEASRGAIPGGRRGVRRAASSAASPEAVSDLVGGLRDEGPNAVCDVPVCQVGVCAGGSRLGDQVTDTGWYLWRASGSSPSCDLAEGDQLTNGSRKSCHVTSGPGDDISGQGRCERREKSSY